MSKKSKIFIIVIVVAIGLLTFLEANEPEPVNWFPSYAKTDKIPLGTFVSYNLIKEAFTDEKVKDINQPPYEFLTDNDTISGTYFFVNGTVNFDKDELNKVLNWVDKGNTLFISAKTIEEKLLDTLQLEAENLISVNNITTKPLLELVNKNLKVDLPYLYDRDIYNSYFKTIDTLKTTVLGITELYKDTLQIQSPKVNYIQQPFGNGVILLHTFPEAFGNYFMLKAKNFEYTQNALTYIKGKPILWDNYYKAGKTFYTSPLFLLLSNRYLKWAYYFVLIAAVLLVIFEGKRKQRSIPIINPLKNQTLAFTRTISGMYFEKEKHKEIAKKQNLLFLEYVRNTLRVPTNNIDEKTIIDIAARSNNTIEDTKELFNSFNTLHNTPKIEKEQLIRLYQLIKEFKSRS
ncbi:DUF4350 domain-containing protein [Aquimarina spongiae]|uniref:DUF4350 domain-containing protein n=1 Tax=Aquimarina spongiae TaxID=570521 RepID=A0A1M6CR75_9FLAO|nr:DUF4350 domain-containing protein [Aquimarina spongiae]SHI63459.1 protein of unknown function [Aquimarina spongiae]